MWILIIVGIIAVIIFQMIQALNKRREQEQEEHQREIKEIKEKSGYDEDEQELKDLNMALKEAITNSKKKTYLFMEFFPYETADEVFNNPIYQKWEYQKPFILIFIKS